ncbi:FadR/GntR family transcriptional regulator [Bacillus thermotolerans]|uniref:Transcriptional regulator, GntR family n=1 Tax=Bacillus thermotolerans TaxID=1221996 RepID=A0A0F5HLB6_BACTR|nr:FadR/GntR family transcriptional regulator [Bacillus thermotolerans]KKB33622.1 Transcriptional regulator, GntR family [Bacillus thermotolerans]KKB41772.1 Transcriptional regulator, GntR family [Bacillus thermotolerans]KKB44336.1 Transcriptional regulator, GntR family [Bacillus thermotolerans]
MNHSPAPKKVFMEIVDQIKQKIIDGTFPVGAKLPPERALMEEFKTSRATVREALRALEIIDVIESRVGQGTFVKTANFSAEDQFLEISQQTSPSEVFEARFAIEPFLAELATRNATIDDLLLIEECLKQSKEAIGHFKEFERLDAEFHRLIAQSSKTALLLSFLDLVNKVRDEKLWESLKARSISDERMLLYYEHHLSIYQAIRERDSDQAREKTLSHLRTVRLNMLGE